MKRTIVLGVIAVFVSIAAGVAQSQMEMPKPAPELKKLDYFVGAWSIDGNMKPGPMGPGGKMTGTETNEWMDGGFFVVGHSTYSGAMGNGKGISVLGYDTDNKLYTYHEFDSHGQAELATGTFDGETWSWTSDEKMGGMTMKGRYSAKVLSPTSYAFKFEVSQDGTNWNLVMDGKATKK